MDEKDEGRQSCRPSSIFSYRRASSVQGPAASPAVPRCPPWRHGGIRRPPRLRGVTPHGAAAVRRPAGRRQVKCGAREIPVHPIQGANPCLAGSCATMRGAGSARRCRTHVCTSRATCEPHCISPPACAAAGRPLLARCSWRGPSCQPAFPPEWSRDSDAENAGADRAAGAPGHGADMQGVDAGGGAPDAPEQPGSRGCGAS